MALTVEELTSAVTVEPGPGTASASERPWDRLAAQEASRDRLAEDERRVRAEGFDD